MLNQKTIWVRNSMSKICHFLLLLLVVLEKKNRCSLRVWPRLATHSPQNNDDPSTATRWNTHKQKHTYTRTHSHTIDGIVSMSACNRGEGIGEWMCGDVSTPRITHRSGLISATHDWWWHQAFNGDQRIVTHRDLIRHYLMSKAEALKLL